MTLELFRRGAHGIVSREVEPEMLVECLRKVAQGEPWLESRAIAWVLQAYRMQGVRPAGSRPKVSLTPKESLIVSCVTQGMKNKEIALGLALPSRWSRIISARFTTSWEWPTVWNSRSTA